MALRRGGAFLPLPRRVELLKKMTYIFIAWRFPSRVQQLANVTYKRHPFLSGKVEMAVVLYLNN